jgi:16S rRNA (uracil1498-N3)-methyltransferase
MARRLFFVPAVRRGVAELTGPEAEHLVRVLRTQPGDTYEISDNEKRYLARVETARKSIIAFHVLEELPAPAPGAFVHLYPALFKFDRFEWMLEKATELNVTTVQPFEATRSEHGLRQAAAKRIARWERIALEGSQQSRRTTMPLIEPAVRLDQLSNVHHPVRLLLDEAESAAPMIAVVEAMWPQRSAEDHIALMLGPEGGWTGEERSWLIAAGWQSCSLGRTILRAETAAMAAIAVVNALWKR